MASPDPVGAAPTPDKPAPTPDAPKSMEAFVESDAIRLAAKKDAFLEYMNSRDISALNEETCTKLRKQALKFGDDSAKEFFGVNKEGLKKEDITDAGNVLGKIRHEHEKVNGKKQEQEMPCQPSHEDTIIQDILQRMQEDGADKKSLTSVILP